MKESLASSNTFADIVSDPWHYNVSLYMFTNLMDKLGPQQAVSAMHSHYREVYYKTGKKWDHPTPLRKVWTAWIITCFLTLHPGISSRQEGLPIRSMRWTSR